jgi:NitT/TauT family transport system ATP-binding protein
MTDGTMTNGKKADGVMPERREPLLRVEHLTKRYRNTDGSESVILDDLSLELEHGEFLCILGPSGCGKTTLLRCLAGFESYEGDVFIDGVAEKRPNTKRTMVFQDFDQLLPWRTVEGNIQFPLRQTGITDKSELQRISDLYLEKVDLAGCAKQYPHQLSGGMKQRAAIARSLAVKPSIILMDEPFASLDAMTRANLQKELLHIKENEDMTVVFITHNIQEALILGTRILCFGRERGEFKLDERPTLQKPVTPETEGYGRYWGMFSKALGR